MGSTTSTTKTNGYVHQEGKTNDTYVANAAVGLTAAEGGPVATINQAWSSSGLNDGHPSGNAGHKVDADGPMTASSGDQGVAVLNSRP